MVGAALPAAAIAPAARNDRRSMSSSLIPLIPWHLSANTPLRGECNLVRVARPSVGAGPIGVPNFALARRPGITVERIFRLLYPAPLLFRLIPCRQRLEVWDKAEPLLRVG